MSEIPIFIAAQDDIADAYFDIAAARRTGEQFAAMFLIRNPRGAHAYEFAAQILRDRNYDEERTVMDALELGRLEINKRPVLELAAAPLELRVGLADVSRLADVLVVRSWHEAAAQRELRGYFRPHVVRWYPSRSLPPATSAARRDLIVVWAPDYSGAQTAIHTFALRDARFEVVVVCRDASGLSRHAKYIHAESPLIAVLLARALCVIDTSLDDPSWAQALAAQGLSVAASSSSGAREVADGISLYDPWSYSSIWSATMQALGRRSSAARESPPKPDVISQALENARPAAPQRQPLVTVVIPTFNRRNDLIRILHKLQAQTYKNFEALVVNDGGESVADVACIDPRITVFDREENVGIFRALNFGISRARGEYVQAEADDDELYPDHLMRLVEALERTRAGVAHSNVLIRYETGRDRYFETNGYNSSIFCCPIDRTEVYASSPVAGNAMIVRRSLFERVGEFDESFVLADQEVQIRLAEASDFVHVPHVTAEWLVRDTGQQFSRKKQGDVVADMRAVFQRHPAPDRPYVAAIRAQALERVAGRSPGIVFPPTVSRGPAGS